MSFSVVEGLNVSLEEIMANEEHVKMLLEDGVEVWNRWCKDKLDISRPDLSGADLIGATLIGANLSVANLSEANLVGADLSEANLSGANLSGASLYRADISEANLSGANLGGADLRNTHLSKANLNGAKLEGTHLANARNVYFDGNQLRETVVSPSTTGPWLTLRRRYTGTKFFLHLCMLIAFILPYVGKAFFWVAVHKGERTVVQRIQQIESDLGGYLEVNVRYHNPENPVSGELQVATNTEPVRIKIADLYKKVEDRTNTMAVGKLLLGFGFDRHWWYPTTAIILIVYNLMRLHLTLSVSELNDEQLRTGYAPRLAKYKDCYWRERLSFLAAKPSGYGPLIWPERIVSLLFWVSFGIFAFHFKDWLTAEVYVWATS